MSVEQEQFNETSRSILKYLYIHGPRSTEVLYNQCKGDIGDAVSELIEEGLLRIDNHMLVYLTDFGRKHASHQFPTSVKAPEHKAAMPHCDSKVLHAPRFCKYCDDYPEFQLARQLWGINFTGQHDPDKLTCPSELRRDLDTINKWPGNRPRTT